MIWTPQFQNADKDPGYEQPEESAVVPEENHNRITMLHAVEKAFEELFNYVTFFNEDRLESESMTGNIFHSMAKSILDNVWLTLPIVVTDL